MKKSVTRCLLEAYRRSFMFDANNLPLSQRWLGLGSETTYRATVKDGYMVWVHPPRSRCMGWLTLTPKGEEVIQKFAQNGVTDKDFTDFEFTGWSKITNI